MDTAQTIGSDTSDAVILEPPSTTHILDPRGDLWIHARGEGSWGSRTTATFRVCSRTLARTSSVFDRLLYGGFSEGKPPKQEDDQESWNVELPEDAAPAMNQLFQIMHCQFKSLETAPKAGADSSDTKAEAARSPTIVRQLYDLTVVADKYDTIGLLRPWVAEWLHALEPKDDDEQDLLRKAWVYYHLGFTWGYLQTGTRLALEFPPAAGRVVLPGAEPATEPTLSPFHFIDLVTDLRLRMISSLLEPIRNTTTVLLEGGSAPLGLCTETLSGFPVADSERLNCESWMLGHLLRVLHGNRLWPIPGNEEVHLSPSTLAIVVQSFSQTGMETTASGLGKRHRSCVPSSATASLSAHAYLLHEDERSFLSKQQILTDVQTYALGLGARLILGKRNKKNIH